MQLVPVHKTSLSNGLTVVVCPKNEAPVVTVDVMYKVGSHDEHHGKSGLAHLFEHLMFDNTSTGMAKQYDTYCTKAGGSNNAYTTHDFTNYFISLPAHQIELGLWLESERMRGFNIKQEHLDTQISVVLEEMKQNVENQPYAKWRFVMAENSFTPECSYSWDVYGSHEDVAGVRLSDAEDFFKRFYNPQNAVLCIAGDIAVDAAYQMAEKYFGSIQSETSVNTRTNYNDSMRLYSRHVEITDAVPMSAAFIGVHAPSMLTEKMFAAELACIALGSGRNSPIHQHMIREKRIASAASVFMDKRAQTSQVCFYAYAANPEVTPDVLVDELQIAIKSYEYSKQDHTKAINKLKSSIASEFQKASGIADSVAFHETFFKNGTLINDLLLRFDRCTLEEVQQCINEYSDLSAGVRVDVVPGE
ncbi:MAG: insulinase family protein [Ignavibacteria bacterium]|nr:insulinase family protein [Ignavibacteria bacterium]